MAIPLRHLNTSFTFANLIKFLTAQYIVLFQDVTVMVPVHVFGPIFSAHTYTVTLRVSALSGWPGTRMLYRVTCERTPLHVRIKKALSRHRQGLY